MEGKGRAFSALFTFVFRLRARARRAILKRFSRRAHRHGPRSSPAPPEGSRPFASLRPSDVARKWRRNPLKNPDSCRDAVRRRAPPTHNMLGPASRRPLGRPLEAEAAVGSCEVAALAPKLLASNAREMIRTDSCGGLKDSPRVGRLRRAERIWNELSDRRPPIP
jgi:hypothetical protein